MYLYGTHAPAGIASNLPGDPMQKNNKLLYRNVKTENKVRERTSTPQPLNLEGSEPDFARRRTAAQLPSPVRRVHPPEGLFHSKLTQFTV